MDRCYYIPYTIPELEEKIKNTLDKIEEYSGSADGDRIRNGQDELEYGDSISSLQKELDMYQSMLRELKKRDGSCSEPSNFTSKLYGC